MGSALVSEEAQEASFWSESRGGRCGLKITPWVFSQQIWFPVCFLPPFTFLNKNDRKYLTKTFILAFSLGVKLKLKFLVQINSTYSDFGTDFAACSLNLQL